MITQSTLNLIHYDLHMPNFLCNSLYPITSTLKKIIYIYVLKLSLYCATRSIFIFSSMINFMLNYISVGNISLYVLFNESSFSMYTRNTISDMAKSCTLSKGRVEISKYNKTMYKRYAQ